jgi:hypothetical protein
VPWGRGPLAPVVDQWLRVKKSYCLRCSRRCAGRPGYCESWVLPMRSGLRTCCCCRPDVTAEQLFGDDAARLILLGSAMHADVPIDAPGSGVMGYC